MPNLIVFLSNHIYHIFYVGFHCMSCVWERVWRLKHLLKKVWISREVSQEAFQRSEPRVEHMTGMWRVMTASFREYFAGISRVRPSREILAKHSVLLFWHICYTIYSPTLYILTLPTYCEECFSKRKPLATTPLESEKLSYPQFSTQSFVVFLNSYLSISKSLKGW